MSSVSMSHPPVPGAAAAASTRPPPAAGSCISSCWSSLSPAKSAAPPAAVTTSAASEGTPPACVVAAPSRFDAGTVPAGGVADATSVTDAFPRLRSTLCMERRFAPPSAARITAAPSPVPGAGDAETSSKRDASVRSARAISAVARCVCTSP
jgi:hypothetical protein